LRCLRPGEARQREERVAAGISLIDSGKVFTEPDDSPVRPEWIAECFDEQVEKYQAVR
jgi:hypothetical protein